MNRLQISLPEWQVRFLAELAERDGVSMAEVVRRLIQREAAAAAPTGAETIWDVAGIAEDHGPLIQGTAVSERPELYLAAEATVEKG
jgi:hypothetical protein